MRISLLRLILSFFISSSALAAPRVRIEPSFILGLWSFASTGTGHIGSPEVKDVYEKSKYHTQENDRLLGEITDIALEYFREGYGFHGAVEGRDEQGWDVTAHFDYQAARSKTLEEFRTRTQGVIPTIKHQQMFKDLKKLEPIYDQLIWQPNLAQLKKDQSRLEAVLKKVSVQKILQNQITFYRANWSDSNPFTIMILPIPATKGHTSATVICDTGLVQVLRNQKNIEGPFGVLIHEIGHSLYSTESPEFQKEMADWFLKSKVPTAQITYKIWEEVLSTITGNGWAFERASGKVDPYDWYNNKEYNDLSKALYPLAKAYLEGNKPVDEVFAHTAIDEFQKLFPDAARRYRRLLRRVLLVSDGTFGESLDLKRQVLTGRKWINQIHFASTLNGDETGKSIAERKPQSALLFLIKPGHQSDLAPLTKLVPDLLALKSIMKPESGYATALDSQGRLTLVIEANDRDDFIKILNKVMPDEVASETPRFFP